jgi:hypothetical protein
LCLFDILRLHMPNTSSAVEEFIKNLDHPYKKEIVAIRMIILHADPQITEQIKWNAPSFCVNGDDRITFRLQPPNHAQLIFHRGAKVKDATNFSFDDPTNLIKWVTKDRGTVTFQNMEEVLLHEKDLQELVKRWIEKTKEN